MKDLHENSTLSLQQQKASGRTTHFRRAIWDTLVASREPMTDRQIMDVLKETDVNNVRPEITRLKQDGLIAEASEKTICSHTGKRVRRTFVCSTVYSEHRTKSKK